MQLWWQTGLVLAAALALGAPGCGGGSAAKAAGRTARLKRAAARLKRLKFDEGHATRILGVKPGPRPKGKTYFALVRLRLTPTDGGPVSGTAWASILTKGYELIGVGKLDVEPTGGRNAERVVTVTVRMPLNRTDEMAVVQGELR